MALDKAKRRCLICGYEGEMKTWLGNYNFPQFLAFFLLLFYIIPGLLFIAWGWGKYKCAKCGSLGKNISIENGETQKCPYCAEIIKKEALKCRYCGAVLPAYQETKIESEDYRKTLSYKAGKWLAKMYYK